MADPVIVDWPAELVPASVMFRLAGTSTSGGASVDGSEQVVVSPGGRWVGTIRMPTRGRDAAVLALRATLWALDGRTNWLRIGPFDGRRASWATDPLTGGPITPARAAASLAADPAYAGNAEATGLPAAALAGPCAMNATGIQVHRTVGAAFRPGQYLSVGGRLHGIVALTSADLGGDAVVGLRIRPWLRDDYPAGAPVEIGSPTGLMRLASDDTGALDLEMARFGSATIELTEAF